MTSAAGENAAPSVAAKPEALAPDTAKVAEAPAVKAAPVELTWTPFEEKHGAYKVALPGTPKPSYDKVDTPQGPRVEQFVMAKVGATMAFGVMYSDYPPALVKELGPLGIARDSRDRFIGKAKASLLKENPVSVGSLTGLDTWMASKVNEALTIRTQHLVAGGRLFQLVVFSEGPLAEADEKAFFDSFEVGADALKAAAAPAWSTFRHPGAGFAVDVIGQPREATEVIPTVAGETKMTTVTFKAQGSAFTMMMVAWLELADNAVDEEAARAALKNGKDQMVANLAGIVVSEKPVTLGERHIGQEVVVEADPGEVPGKILVRARHYVVGNRLYMLQALRMKGTDETIATRFLESFKLVEN